MKALISVSNKEGIVEFAKELTNLNIDLISTGGTYKVLSENGIKVTEVSEYTKFNEMLDGRVKTLNPIIHAGILAKKDNLDHQRQLKENHIDYIDFVVCNLYPFKQTIQKKDVTFSEAIENIDIGGPTMLRSAAKNFQDVCVITDPNDYFLVIKQLKETGKVSYQTRLYLMEKVFTHTSYYDSLICSYLKNNSLNMPNELTLNYELVSKLRYGENPHQEAYFYKDLKTEGTLCDFKQLHGKELSFNNINDASSAIDLLKEFDKPTVVCLKHTNPCAVSSNIDINKAWFNALNADPKSVFGGIVSLNRTLTKTIAESMNEIFLEVVIAPSYEEEALKILIQKKNIRLLELPSITKKIENELDFKKVSGGLIVQTKDNVNTYSLKTVTKKEPTEKELNDLLFAYKVVKHTKSNAICICKDETTLGIAPGQVNRIWATTQCIEHAIEIFKNKEVLEGSVCASDAFFPFDDCVRKLNEYKISSIIQPGGSVKDLDSIEACDEFNISMVFSGIRHFKH